MSTIALATAALAITTAICGAFPDANPEDLVVRDDQSPNVSFGVMVDRGEYIDSVSATVDVALVNGELQASIMDEFGRESKVSSLEAVVDDLSFEYGGAYADVLFMG